MKMYRLFGILNALLSILFIFIIADFSYSHKSILSVIETNLPNVLFACMFAENVYIAYLFFRRELDKKAITRYISITAVTFIWFILFFVGYFFASDPKICVLFLICAFVIYFVLRQTAKPIALKAGILTMVVFLVMLISGLKDDYCSLKSMQADPSGAKFVRATKQDVALLKDWHVKEGARISESLRVQQLCRKNFNYISAIKDSYFSVK